jgi:hypothetical protein
MPTPTEPGTKTVRIDADAASELRTIAALKERMGIRFKPVEFLNALVVGPIHEEYEATLKAFESQRKRKKA